MRLIHGDAIIGTVKSICNEVEFVKNFIIFSEVDGCCRYFCRSEVNFSVSALGSSRFLRFPASLKVRSVPSSAFPTPFHDTSENSISFPSSNLSTKSLFGSLLRTLDTFCQSRPHSLSPHLRCNDGHPQRRASAQFQPTPPRIPCLTQIKNWLPYPSWRVHAPSDTTSTTHIGPSRAIRR